MNAKTQEESRMASPSRDWSIQVNRSKRVKEGTRCFRPADYFIPYAVHRPSAMTPIQQTSEHHPSVLAPAGARILAPQSFIVGATGTSKTSAFTPASSRNSILNRKGPLL